MNEYPCWWDTPGLRPPGSSKFKVQREKLDAAEIPAHADVAIVGAGYTGLAAARHLARSGAAVVVFDRERAGWGASSRNGGQVLTGLKLDATELVARFGESRARELFEVSLESIATLERLIDEEHLDCDYERSGHVDAANKPSHFDAFRREQDLLARVFHHRVELVPASEQRAEIGSAVYHGLMLDERSGALNPAKYVDQLAQAACRAGARIVEGTAVKTMLRQGAGWTVETSRGVVQATDVLVATNGYTNGAAPWLQRRLVPIGSHIIATEPLGEDLAASLIPKRRMVFDSKHFLHYFRLTRDNRVFFGGRAEFGRSSTNQTRRCAEILRRDLVAIFPTLGTARIEYAWSGNVAFTRDQLPHAGQMDGVWYSAGYCGHGVAMGTYLGTTIARRLAGETFVHPLVDHHFPAIPLYRGTPWFLPLVGAYYTFLDWVS